MTVVALETPNKRLNQEAIAVLEEMLAKAKSGEIVAVAVASVAADRVTGGCTWGNTDCVPALLGAIGILQHRLTDHAVSIAVAS